MKSRLRQYPSLPRILWGLVVLSFFYILAQLWLPFADTITLNGEIIKETSLQIGRFLLAVLGSMALLELFVYQLFFRQPKNQPTALLIRGIQGLLGVGVLFSILSFFETTSLLHLGEGWLGKIIRLPATAFAASKQSLLGSGWAEKSSAGLWNGLLWALGLLLLLGLIQALSVRRNSKLGLAYLLVLPAFVGIAFLIIYPFIFEVKLAFSNASLGTKATKEASYGLIYGWENLKTLFTGTVAKDATFFEVFGRTVLWTVINVTFHVTGGMFLAILLNREMRFRGLYRALLVVPWAIPGTIAAMALRNEFDSRYGMFNILLGNAHDWLAAMAQKAVLLSGAFAWLAEHIGPVSWRQDPTWAFVSVLIANIWLGIPFMMIIILGGLQSISHEYYEAAEIDGASKWQQFRHITLPLLKPVLTPAVVLGVVWTFNKLDIIYLITQGGPQEKTDILVTSMYKAAFSFYRYGFTAMFALVIFIILLVFALIYLRVTGGLKSVTE